MRRINFNSPSFKEKGFEISADILVDSCVIRAYLNPYDSWHETVNELFENHILNNDKPLFLYVNATIINEVTHLLSKSSSWYEERHSVTLSNAELSEVKNNTVNELKNYIENDVLSLLESNKSSVQKQLEIFDKLGSADALNASIVNEYGISFLTVDNRLVSKMAKIQDQLTDIHNVYYTYSTYQA